MHEIPGQVILAVHELPSPFLHLGALGKENTHTHTHTYPFGYPPIYLPTHLSICPFTYSPSID